MALRRRSASREITPRGRVRKQVPAQMEGSQGQLDGVCSQWGTRVSDLAVMLALAAPHILYAFVWFKPDVWRSYFKDKAVDALGICGVAGKGLQFAAVLSWLASRRSGGLCFNLADISLAQWAAFLSMFVIGQVLNVATYWAIGHVGVYYGFKLGHHVPWHNGFPFSVMPHPQYVGSAMSVWAVVILAWEQAPTGTALVALYWTFLYVATGVWEQFF